MAMLVHHIYLKRTTFVLEWVEFLPFTVGDPGFKLLSGDRYHEVFSPKCLDRLWSAFDHIFNGYLGIFPKGQSDQGLETYHSLPSSTLPYMPSWFSDGQLYL
jgi:hypothetical protein